MARATKEMAKAAEIQLDNIIGELGPDALSVGSVPLNLQMLRCFIADAMKALPTQESVNRDRKRKRKPVA